MKSLDGGAGGDGPDWRMEKLDELRRYKERARASADHYEGLRSQFERAALNPFLPLPSEPK